jgi:hypothetical protein
MTTERKQPALDELQALLDACRGFPATVSGVAWNERVAALQEAANLRTQWRSPEEKELLLHIRRYLRGAGVLV